MAGRAALNQIPDALIPGERVAGPRSPGLFTLPTPLASYRELGILQRLSTTPVPASRELGVQLILNLCLAVAAVVILVVAGVAAFGLRLPRTRRAS